MATHKSLTGTKLSREFRIQREHVDAEDRTVELAFSSDAPLTRFFGIETLSHEEGAARLDRLNGGGALLIDHDVRDQVGVIEDARLEDDGVGRATVRFGQSPRASEIFTDVLDGIRSLVSVGYLIHAEDVTHGEGGAPDQFRITDWEPLEVSFVAVPADASVGVGRAQEDDGGARSAATLPAAAGATATSREGERIMEGTDALPLENGADDDARGGDTRAAPDTSPAPEPVDRTAVDAEIRRIGERFDRTSLAEDYIELGADAERFRAAVLDSMPKPQATAMPVDDGARFEMKGRHTIKRRVLDLFGPDRQTAERNAHESGMWARAVIFGDERAARWCRDRMGSRAMAGGIVSKGGAVVPDVMSSAIIDLRELYGVARQLCRVFPMSSDTLQIPRRTGGVTASWKGENVALTASDKSWDVVQLVAKKLTALTRLSTEYAEDAVIDVAGDLADEMAWAFAEAEDDAYLNGDGSDTYGGITGIRVKLVDGTHTAGAVDATSGSATFAELVAADLESCKAVVPVFASMGAKWLASKPGKVLVFDSLNAAAGGNTITDLGNGPAPNYQGDEIVLSQKMPVLTTDIENVAMLLYGRFDLATSLGDRRGFRVTVLNELYAASDQIGVMATERLDIVTHDLGDTSTAGPVAGVIGA